MSEHIRLDPVPAAIAAIAAGRPVVVVDDADRVAEHRQVGEDVDLAEGAHGATLASATDMKTCSCRVVFT